MANDKLHRKSITAVFFLMAAGISLFLYTPKRNSGGFVEEARPKANLANIQEQLQGPASPALEGFKNLSKEAEGVYSETTETGSPADQLLPQVE
ncbi:MAG: hypothetical protein HZB99_03915 [Candidatus Harrisonbacteria bacterium]|nr:hypothetical protein [Candidatus Harrisonbacteria bacterium]